MKRADTTAVKVLTGEFAKSPLAEVLHLLHQDKETATLVCRNGDKKRAIFLWRGQVADVDTSVPGEKLVDMLRSMGKVEDDQHQHVADHEGGLKSQAQLLVELGVLPVREVAAYIRVHIVGVIQALFEESEGIFKLILGEIPDRGFSVRIPVPELLFAGAKHIRSYETLQAYLEPVERKILPLPGRSIEKSWHLSPPEEQLIESFRQRPTIQKVLSEAGQNRLAVAALIYCLEVVGYLQASDPRKSASDTALRRARAQKRKEEEAVQDREALPKPEEEKARLPKPEKAKAEKGATGTALAKATSSSLARAVAPGPPQAPVEPEDLELPVAPPEEEGVDLDKYADLEIMTYYQMLGIESSALDAEVKAGYFRLAKQYHPDRFFGQAEEFIAAVRRIFEAQSRAYNVLKDPVQRRDYDRSLAMKARGKGPVGEAAPVKESDEVTRGKINYQQAVQALEVKNFQAAVDALKRALDANPNEARYWGTLAEIQSRFARWKAESLNSITRALELQPDNTEYLYIQAQLLYRQNDFDGAQRAMKRAVTLDRENAKYQDLLAEIESKNPGKKGPRKNADKGGLFGRIFGS